MIHERNARGNARVPLSVKVDGYGDVGLFRRADHFCFSHKKSPVFGKCTVKMQKINQKMRIFPDFLHFGTGKIEFLRYIVADINNHDRCGYAQDHNS